MEILSSYDEYKTKLVKGLPVETRYSYVGRWLLPIANKQSFLVIFLDDKEFDVCYYKYNTDNSWHIDHIEQGKKHRLQKTIKINYLNNKKNLDAWNQICYKDENEEIYQYDDKYDTFSLTDSSEKTIKDVISDLKKEIERWNIDARNYPVSIVYANKWSQCALIAYCCQQIITSEKTYWRKQSDNDIPDNSVSYSKDDFIFNRTLPIGDGITLDSLLTDKVKVSVPILPEMENMTFFGKHLWEELIKQDEIDYYIGGIPYSSVGICAGYDMEGNIWIEVNHGSDVRRILIHETSVVKTKRKPISSSSKPVIKPKEIDVQITAMEEESCNAIRALSEKCNNKCYTTDSIYSIDVQKLEDLHDEIKRTLTFDYILTDTNVWMTSDGWNASNKPVLKYRDMLVCLSILVKQNPNNNCVFELEGTAYNELIKHTKNKDNSLACDSATEAKCLLNELKKKQLVVIKEIRQEMTQEEQKDYINRGGNLKDYYNVYADPYIRKHLIELISQKYKILVLTRDVDLRLRLYSACRDEYSKIIDNLSAYPYPCIIEPEAIVPIMHTWYRIEKEIARRKNKSQSLDSMLKALRIDMLFSKELIVRKPDKDSKTVPVSNKKDN